MIQNLLKLALFIIFIAGLSASAQAPKWAAIVYNSVTGAYGYSWDKRSLSEAQTAARFHCKGTCYNVGSAFGSGKCVAVAWDVNAKYHYRVANGLSQTDAGRKALYSCQGRSTRICKYWAVCNSR